MSQELQSASQRYHPGQTRHMLFGSETIPDELCSQPQIGYDHDCRVRYGVKASISIVQPLLQKSKRLEQVKLGEWTLTLASHQVEVGFDREYGTAGIDMVYQQVASPCALP